MKVVGSAGFWLLASTTSSELRCNNGGGGDGYIPTGELLGFPHSSSTHSGTMNTELFGDYVLRFRSVWFVFVKFYSI
jgi:hypothetical protein